ncbi:MAG: beta strand repeat-containing protein, partial [Solirubrobacteraceae bacterium]
ATDYDPLLAAFQATDPATGKPYTDDFGWISHTWDHPNIDEGCATQNYIEAELNQNTIWGGSAPGATVGDSLTGGLGLTESTDATDALGNENPNVVITGEHSGLANLLPGNPGQVDPPALDAADADSSAGSLASGEYVYAVSDQFNTAAPGATPVAATGESTASESSPVTVTGPGEVKLTWGAVCKAADYKIYRAPFTPGAAGTTGTTGTWSLIGTVPAVTTTGTSPDTTSDFRDPTSTTDTTGGGAAEKTFVDAGAAGSPATPPSESTADESAYEQNPALDAAFAGTLSGGIKYFGADASKPYPSPADGSFATGTTPAGEYPAGATFQDAGATAIPRYPTNIYYNVSTNAQEVDEYETLYDLPSTGGTGRCTPVAGVTTCNPAGTTFTIAQIVASVDQGMFQHMMGNDPRPSYFHQTNLMDQTSGNVNGEGDGLFYETLNPLLAEYNQDFASNAPIEQLTMAQIGTLLTEQSAWAANTSVSGYIEGNQVTITNSGSAAVTVPLTGITNVGSSYGGTQTGWTSIPTGTSPALTSSTTWPTSAAQAPAITSTDGAWFTVGSAGDFAVTTTGLPTAAITETGSLPSGVSFVDNANGTATLAGTPAAGTGGSYPITITAANGIGASATQTFTVIVDQAPAITSSATDTATAGAPLTAFTVTTSGYPAPALSETGALPSGVTFLDNDNGNATLAGTPAAGTAGSYPITITAANGIGTSATQSFTLTVDQAPAITSANAATFTAGTAGSFAVTTTGLPTPTPITESGALPGGVTFVDNGSGTATLAGTPAAATGGSYPITITAANGISPNATQSFTLTVDQAPAITSANATTFTTGTAGSFAVTTTGSSTSGPTITESGTLPSGVTFTDNGSGTATLAGTPAAGTAGSYPITITAANGISPNATQSFTLTVSAQAPAITSANATTFTAGTAGSFTVSTTGSPTPALTESGALPGGVTFVDNGDGTATLSGTPTSGGSFPLSITASSAAGTVTQSFTLTVGQAPAITSTNAATFTAGTAGSFTVSTTGSPSPALTDPGVALPSGVTFVDNGNGTATLSGTPAAGTAGSYAVTITATNGTGTATQSFTLTVDQAPAITSAATATVAVGKALNVSVTTTGSPTSAISESGALPSGVTFTDNGTGTATLAGTPAAGTGASYPITITATNAAGRATQSFTLTVDQAPAITSAATATAMVGTTFSFPVQTSGYPVATITESGALHGLTFTAGTGASAGTATISGKANAAGVYNLVLTAANGVSPNATQTLVLTVQANGGPTITSAASATATVATSFSFTVTTSGTPAATITESGALHGLTFTAGTGTAAGTATIAGTPTAGGVFTLTITAKNTLGSAVQTFTLTVNQVPAITSAATTTAKVGTAFSFTVKTSGYPVPAITESGTLPAGVAFTDNGTGTATITGTPTAGGVFTLTITAKNSAGTSAAQTVTLTVSQVPVITSAATATGTVGTPLTAFTVTASGTPAPSLTKTGSLPGGVTFTNNANGTATIKGTPTTSGVFTLTITAKNSAGTSAAQTFTLTVSAPPKITSAATTTGTENTALSFAVKTTGYPTPTISESGALPAGVTFTSNTNGTATIAGTPTASGTFTLTLTAKNSLGTATQTLTIRVSV